VDDDVTAVAAAQVADLVEADDLRVAPDRLGIAHRRGDDVLGRVVELVSELAVALGPVLRELLPSATAEQQRVRIHRLVELELVAVLAALELERPAAALEVLGPARVLEDAVQRHELRYDDPGHRFLLPSGSRAMTPGGSGTHRG
jgi:hypothetical protein